MVKRTEGIWHFIPNYAKHQAEAILGFTVTFLARRYDEPKPIPVFHEEMWALCSTGHKQVAIAAPRGHAKSTAITFAYALYLLLTRKSKHMLLISSNESIASEFLHDIKIELQENELLMEYFGIDKFIKDSESEIVVRFETGEKFRVLCKGANQRMRGLKWERKRPDYVLCDDMEDEELVMNDERRDKFKNWFLGAVKPIIRSGGKIRVVGTVMHMDSLLMNMMPAPKDIDTYTDELVTYSKKWIDRPWLSIKYRGHNEDFSKILWPEQFTKEWFQLTRADFAEMGKLDIYGQEFLNHPIDPTTAFFRRADFLEMEEKHFPVRKEYYASIDMAISEKKRRAYTCIVVGGMDADGYLNIVDVRRDRWDGLGIVDEMFSTQTRWDIDTWRVEEENIARSLGSFLYKSMDERQEYLVLDCKTPTKDKDQRAQAIRARMRAGKVRFDKTAEWYPDLEEEMCNYPKHPTADQVDAIAWLGLLLLDMIVPPTPEEEDEDEYQTQLEDYHSFGRSATTGY